ncbi:hypothetical protein PPL_01467 [Heterostelium album PN500]|uniref:Uncharacterized protein n=1 Tax=Heterostelium pallidum (strain ATCC 26659 / Pp 5 / PN500) TaxID=670386 RepID=D3AZC7_HETP5|nr:hypothetical protein PPL_01467 [Heterostelium album PN500]EFA85510.1 hypothetical protein PPL_01467 [Heterostelium album PN500]|eukprot:XP_020437618.1 hypothetical protein PPL_01467 [Heterostelium album PN500]
MNSFQVYIVIISTLINKNNKPEQAEIDIMIINLQMNNVLRNDHDYYIISIKIVDDRRDSGVCLVSSNVKADCCNSVVGVTYHCGGSAYKNSLLVKYNCRSPVLGQEDGVDMCERCQSAPTGFGIVLVVFAFIVVFAVVAIVYRYCKTRNQVRYDRLKNEIEPLSNTLDKTVDYFNFKKRNPIILKHNHFKNEKVSLLFINIYFFFGALPTTTNWNSISPLILQNFTDGLPKIPTSVLQANFSGYPDNPFTIFTLDLSSMPANACGQSLSQTSVFPQQAIEYGGVQQGACRVLIDGNMIQLMNKRQPDNSVPVSANPSWVQFRFPLPDKATHGTPQKVKISMDTRGGNYGVTSFGGSPCGPLGCNIRTEGPWDPQAKAGYYILLGTPAERGASSGYTILGPFSDDPVIDVPIPTEYKTVKELDVVVFAVSTYPYNTGCPSSGACYIYLHKILRIDTVSLYMGIDFTYSTLPPTGHPRLFGNHSSFWETKVKPFWELACDNYAPGGLSVHNIRDDWEVNLFGGSICKNNRYPFETNPVVKNYLQGTLSADLNIRFKEGRNALFLIRFLQSCFYLQRADCVYTTDNLNTLIPKVIDGELKFWNIWGVWYDGYSDGSGTFGFDLGTPAPLKFWSTYVDTLWNNLNNTIITMIVNKMDGRGFDYRRVYKTQGWALWNGNNWTPVLSSGAVYYSVVRWYENATLAQGVMTDMLSVLYRTRQFFLSDGVYVEGLAHYTTMTCDGFMEIDYLINSALGIHTFALDWSIFEKVHKWVLDAIMTDSFTMDFGDSHFSQYGSLTPIYSMYIPEIIGYGQPIIDPCTVLRFWLYHYFSSGLDQNFDNHKVIARNWTQITSQCKSFNDSVSFYPLGGNGMFRNKVKEVNAPMTSRSKLAEFTNLAMEGKYNGYPHTESDFGGFIWSGYGARFLYDMSYGTIAKTDKTLEIDNNPAGANTLVVEDAFFVYPNNTVSTTINKSQFSPVRGTIEQLEITQDGINFKMFKLDGSEVYGKSQPNDGWLKRFYRYAISIPGGHYIIADTFTKHSRFTTQNLDISEFFYSGLDNQDPTSCGLYTITNTMSVINDKLMQINPMCRNVGETSKPPVARVAGEGLNGNPKFVYDGNITFSGVIYNRRVRVRFNGGPTETPDARAFLLVAADNSTAMPSTISMSKLACTQLGANTKCLEASVDTQSYRLEFSSDSEGYSLSCIRPKVGGTYSNGVCQSTTSTTTTTGSTSSAPVSTTDRTTTVGGTTSGSPTTTGGGSTPTTNTNTAVPTTTSTTTPLNAAPNLYTRHTNLLYITITILVSIYLYL